MKVNHRTTNTTIQSDYTLAYTQLYNVPGFILCESPNGTSIAVSSKYNTLAYL